MADKNVVKYVEKIMLVSSDLKQMRLFIQRLY